MEHEDKNPLELQRDYNNNRKFSERASLIFNFNYNKNAVGTVSPIKITIPLYENPTIIETKQARLGKYKPIGRNSNLYAFLGADSKVISLTFNLTLPHLMFHCSDPSLSQYITRYTKTDPQADFKLSNKKEGEKLYNNIIKVIDDYHNNFYGLKFDDEVNIFNTPELINPNNFDVLREVLPEQQTSVTPNRVKALYYFWTNVIRCSVIGTTDHTGSPPIVKFNFGPLYKGTPFIVEKYTISFDDNKVGYDVATLLPNRVKITLEMEEFRTGNFGNYAAYGSPGESGSPLDGENVAGWEFITKTGSLDPIYSAKES